MALRSARRGTLALAVALSATAAGCSNESTPNSAPLTPSSGAVASTAPSTSPTSALPTTAAPSSTGGSAAPSSTASTDRSTSTSTSTTTSASASVTSTHSSRPGRTTAAGAEQSPATSTRASSTSSTRPTRSTSGTGGKPSRAEVTTGLQAFYRSHAPGGANLNTDAYAACIVDEGYDSFSRPTLMALKNGTIDTLPYKDLNEFTTVASGCVGAASR